MQPRLMYTVDIVQLHVHISCLTSSLQSVVLLLMFVEVIVVMARNDYHPRVLRALRPIFFINSQLMYAMRRWIMMYHAFNMCLPASITLASRVKTNESYASCSWVCCVLIIRPFTYQFIPLPQQGDEGDLQGVYNYTGCDTPSAVFDRHLFHFW